MKNLRKRLFCASLFLAFTGPFGIVAHLASEAGGLGAERATLLAFSARHAYLAFAGIFSIVGIAVAIGCVRGGDARARARSLSAVLPFGGRGSKFVSLSMATQFAFFAATQLAEGAPLASGNIIAGVVAAALASAVGALVLAVAHRRVVAFVLGIIAVFVSIVRPLCRPSRSTLERRPRARSARRSPFAFRYRPPPCAA